MFKHSITLKTLSIIILALLSIFSSIGWYIYQSQTAIINDLQSNQKEYIIKQLNRTEKISIDQETANLKKLSSSILGAITQALYNIDEVTIQASILKFMQNETIKAVQIYDKTTHSTFINAYKDKNNKIKITKDALDKKRLKLQSLNYKITNQEVEIGFIKIYYDNNKIIKNISHLKEKDLNTFSLQAQSISKRVGTLLIKQIIIFIIGVIMMAILITYLLIKFVNNPLNKLQLGLNSFFLFLQGKQNSTQQIEINSMDEFGQMAKSLNENIAVSAKLHDDINELNTNLEKKVLFRTQELALINQELQDSIEYASVIQRSFLKSEKLIKEEFNDAFIIWQPRDKVGGDLYIFEKQNKGIIFGVVDCTGHSVPGGFMTMLAGSIIKKLSNDFFDDPGKLLSELNIAIKHQLSQDRSYLSATTHHSLSDDGLDMGLCFINQEKKLLTFAGAKIDLVYFKKDSLEQIKIKADKQSIGYKKSKKGYKYINHELKIDGAESFYLYSDGITDQTGGDNNYPYSQNKFKQLLTTIQDKSMHEQKSIILDELTEYQGTNSRRDDITVIGFKV